MFHFHLPRSVIGPLLGGYLSKKEAIRPLLHYLPFLKDVSPRITFES